MNKNYNQLAASIQQRSNPENLVLEKSFSDELSSVQYNDLLRYITLAMNGVDPAYTEKSKLAGERVKNHLKETLSDVVYRYQGSVMTNTHIKGTSDIDLLVITDKFYTFDRAGIEKALSDYNQMIYLKESQINSLKSQLQGGGYGTDIALQDLRENRLHSEHKLKDKYEIYDITRPKSIKITNQHLKRDVDIVIANWYDDVKSVINDKNDDYRGIQVYNKQLHSKGDVDYPFLSIKRINDRSADTQGRLKKMIRLLKNIKADSDKEIELSSFDFNAICYDIDISTYKDLNKYMLVGVVLNKLIKLATDGHSADNLTSVDGREYIFRNNSGKLQSLRNLMGEVSFVLNDLKTQL
ncbi:nucleotidyltransferase domain-containing protein [Olivibacter sp. SDN3]|uniref:nucleotidyltransferase domain-containing protein n=1 Tax=Olivibacter sp. SDN3 TaxID=2764720 RepID=UPI001651A0CB|nr:nucleotidyltransferase domain-containing protein [Olivibacter sp. SDN3]QNL48948.1 nucleotidyltransferase domain-containing protein [Olivibacter sp. SDN3]